MKTLLPEGWPRPNGYANAISATGRTIYTAGVVGWDAQEDFVSSHMAGQFKQTLRNIVDILAVDNARPEHIVRLTCYVTSIDQYLASTAEIGAAYEAIIGPHYPAMALVEVVRLSESA